VIEFDREDARVSGEVRAAPADFGTPIGPLDTLIAGQALARGFTVVTRDSREFSRVTGLGHQNWEE
jgi:tRNA(fMet)-specific endonuclease VapC